MRKNDRIKLTAAILLGGCAIFIAWFQLSRSEEAPPVDPTLAKPWYCHTCQAGFLLTPDQYEATIGNAVHPAYEGETGDTTAMVMVVQCPTCGKLAVAARRCEEHQVIFDPRDPDATKRSCPQCPQTGQ